MIGTRADRQIFRPAPSFIINILTLSFRMLSIDINFKKMTKKLVPYLPQTDDSFKERTGIVANSTSGKMNVFTQLKNSTYPPELIS
jgi:hypothetical protein